MDHRNNPSNAFNLWVFCYNGHHHERNALGRAMAQKEKKFHVSDIDRPLHELLQRENATASEIDVLVKLGANVNSVDGDGFPALVTAVCNSNHEAVAALIGHGANVNAVDDQDHDTALHHALTQCPWETCKLLIDSGADLLAENDNGQKPLHGAVWGPQGNVANLLALMKNPLVRDKHLHTVAHEMAVWGKTAEIDLLKDRPALLSATNTKGRTPLEEAAERNLSTSVAAFWKIFKKVDWDAYGAQLKELRPPRFFDPNAARLGALRLAISKGNFDVVLAMRAHGARGWPDHLPSPKPAERSYPLPAGQVDDSFEKREKAIQANGFTPLQALLCWTPKGLMGKKEDLPVPIMEQLEEVKSEMGARSMVKEIQDALLHFPQWAKENNPESWRIAQAWASKEAAMLAIEDMMMAPENKSSALCT
jgi:ankyrin repeat protein